MSGATSGLEVRGLVAGYAPSSKKVVDDVTVAVPAGRTLAMVGPSGAGKSTLLRAICGLHPLRGGDVLLGGVSLVNKAPQARRIAMVFADDALLAHLSVEQNLRFVMRNPNESRLEDLAKAFGINLLLERKPSQLSTGERRRASIARALLSDPQALLLDEPFAALDPDLRVRLRDELLHVRELFGGPIILVTHDHTDAMAVADEIAVLIDGTIHDVGEPQRVYDRPGTLAVATFFGERPMNWLSEWQGNRFAAGMFRPERAVLTIDGRFRGNVNRIERMGADAYVHVLTQRYGVLLIRLSTRALPHLGDEIAFDVGEDDICIYHGGNGRPYEDA